MKCLHSPEIRPEAGKFFTLALNKLMASQKLGGSAWSAQFAFGFPIAGSLSHRRNFPLDGKFRGRIPSSRLFRTAAHRFKELSLKSGLENAQQLLTAAMEQVKRGWLLPPTPLASDGNLLSWRPSIINISFRFGGGPVFQTARL